MEAEKGKSQQFQALPSPCIPGGQEGVSRRSRNRMILLIRNFSNLLVRPVYLLRRAGECSCNLFQQLELTCRAARYPSQNARSIHREKRNGVPMRLTTPRC
jgi:hypothetical protein